MEELRKAHKGPNVMNGTIVERASGYQHDDPAATERAVHRLSGGDPRLALFGYSVETITMLLLPMVQTKLVTLETRK
jgi:hypothetical protein